MSYDPEFHHRRSIRLAGFDYSKPGRYFVTICTQDRACILSQIVEGAVQATALGKLIQQAWLDIPSKCPGLKIGDFVLMPNHLHGILCITQKTEPPDENRQISLPEVVDRFKSFTTHLYRQAEPDRKKRLSTKLWQRNYYEHIIRDDADQERVHLYIERNPLLWEIDRDNPMCRIRMG